MGSIESPPIELTLPASWYSNKSLYELERRAVFGKHWLLVTHESRLSEAGDYASYTLAGHPIVLIRGRDGNINAFLNVCRHRAFPVVLKESGTANILACKYHGWSYGLNGKLAKAPHFETVEAFNKDEYSLFKVHLHIDRRGFVYVNLDVADVPSISWQEQFAQADAQPRLQEFDMTAYRYDHSWSMIGAYNWKTLMDNYNECYHCSVAHPGIAATTNLNAYYVETNNGSIEHHAEAKPGADVGDVAPTFLFPNTSITMTVPYFYLMRVLPTGPESVRMEYEVYRNSSATNEEFEETDKFFKQIEREDKFLCENAQKNLSAGGYSAGPLHPHDEKGVLHFKSWLKRIVVEHAKQEKAEGRTISPASRMTTNATTLEEEAFCKSLCPADGDQENAGLQW